MSTTPEQALKQYFGYDSFRLGQEEIIENILDGRDCLCVMPTGAGKSMCFHVPALIMDGITIVISPLISLMKDQVYALNQAGVPAAYINSSLTDAQVRLAMSKAEKGLYKIIYVAPERLESAVFMSFAKKAAISMITVDEAHCISQWGQDFRPSYLKVVTFVKGLAKRPVVSAFTATATDLVREDIVRLLELCDPKILVTGFDRENLFFGVRRFVKDKFDELTKYLAKAADKSGIVYCSTRAAVDEVSDMLKSKKIAAAPYHAGLSSDERTRNQEDFLHDRVQVMVATNAFGMGIDKSNVRFVIHYNMPMDLEGYYQEAGRAGRDGERADCILFYNDKDIRTNLWLIEHGGNGAIENGAAEKTLKDRDLKRLKLMKDYCLTAECLRERIMRYFGEKFQGPCGNCSNCGGLFEKRDITTEAKKLLSCVIRIKERFGITMVVDILRGKKSRRLESLGFDRLSTYNISLLSQERLRDIANFLTVEGYLHLTQEAYPVLKRGPRAKELLAGDAFVEMKVPKENSKRPAAPDIKPQETPVSDRLFSKLKFLRLKIADEEKVPAFVIFSDTSLADMCRKMPVSEDDFREVSGVGDVKLRRYGRRFLDTIAEFAENPDAENAEDSPGRPSHKGIEISNEPVTVKVIADRISKKTSPDGIKRLTGANINNWLINEGFLHLSEQGTKPFKRPTAQGKDLGIHEEDRIIRGEDCLVNYYNIDAQKFIIDSLYKP